MIREAELPGDQLPAHDLKLRGLLTRRIAELGRAPDLPELAAQLECGTEKIEAGLMRLARADALLVHPGTARPWAVHPFALAPGSCWVRTPRRGYWANCLYCALGIAAALRSDAIVTTRYGGEETAVQYRVSHGIVEPTDDLFHLSTPPAKWWDNVVFACSSFQPFRNMDEIMEWCLVHDLPLGAVLPMDQLWTFARDWYGEYLDRPWRRRTAAEIREIFRRNGLTGELWDL